MRRPLIAVMSLVAACNTVQGQDTKGSADTRSQGPSAPASATSAAQTAECTVTWKPGSDACQSQGATSACTTLFRGSFATLEEAQAECKRAYGTNNHSSAEACDSCRWVPTAADRKN